MYQEQIKQAYIDYRNSTVTIDPNLLQRLFNKTAKYEEEAKKDLCDFNKDEVEALYHNLHYTALSTIRMHHTQFRRYAEWCIENGHSTTNENHFKDFNRSSLNQFVDFDNGKRKVISRKQLLEWCAHVDNASDAFLLLAVFEGIRGDEYCELLDLEESECNLSERTVYLKNRGYAISISPELCDYIDKTIKEYEYISSRSVENRNYVLLKTGKVLKFRNTARTKLDVSLHQRSRRVYHRFIRVFEQVNVGDILSIKALTYSGMLNYILEGSKAESISKYEYWHRYYDRVAELYQMKSITQNDFYREFHEYIDN